MSLVLTSAGGTEYETFSGWSPRRVSLRLSWRGHLSLLHRARCHSQRLIWSPSIGWRALGRPHWVVLLEHTAYSKGNQMQNCKKQVAHTRHTTTSYIMLPSNSLLFFHDPHLLFCHFMIRPSPPPLSHRVNSVCPSPTKLITCFQVV